MSENRIETFLYDADGNRTDDEAQCHQTEQRHGQRVEERGQGRRCPDPVDLS